MAIADFSNHPHCPPWLQRFLHAHYFTACPTHHSERNHFCVDCNVGPLCSLGLHQFHSSHKTLQIRKASHYDAVRITDVHELLDISHIQTYVINSAKIVFLLARVQKGSKGFSKACESCGRGLVDPVRYCSIECKLCAIEEADHDWRLSLIPQARLMDAYSGQRQFQASMEHEWSAASFNCCEPCEGGEIPMTSMKRKRIRQANGLQMQDAPLRKRKISSVMKNVELNSWALMETFGGINSTMPAKRFDSPPPAPTTPPSIEPGSLRAGHRRKGTPHRAPLC